MIPMRRLAALPAALGLAGCFTIGREFETTQLQWLRAGETKKAEVLEKLGTPFRIGVDTGDPTWTYGYYRYALVGSTTTKDLVIRWAADGSVKSFTFSTSFPEEKETLEPALKETPAPSATTGS